MSDNKKWVDLGFSEKTKLLLSIFLIFSSVTLGFMSFIWLQYVPSSVLALDTMWISSGLGLLGLSAYITQKANELNLIVSKRLIDIDNEEKKLKNERNLEGS